MRACAIGAVLIVGIAAAANAAPSQAYAAPAAQTIKELLASREFETRAGDSRLLTELRAFYQARGYEPAWTGSTEALRRANTARQVLAQAAEQGLNAADYTLPPQNESTSARTDAAFTQSVLSYAHDLRSGRLVPTDVYRDVGLPDTSFDAAPALAKAVAEGTLAQFFVQIPPPHEEYRDLVTALARYRAIAAKGGWPSIPADREVKFDGDPRLALLRQRLAAEEPGAALAGDDDLIAAVKRYQARNGLDPDGRVGRRTLEMLDIPAAERVRQIEANLERWRWMPRAFERRYIVVNVPDQSLRFVEDGKTLLTSRVIVGRPQNPSPIFRAAAIAVTANPPWNVPPSIAVKEILPKLRRDPNYLASQNMILLNGPAGDPEGLHVDWRNMTAARFSYRIQQVPGAQNALGRLKLELPNRFDVYLHDTPGKIAFERNERALSHGCIRVQQILPLATLALGGDRDTARQTLDAAIATGTTQEIKLPQPLPVYVLYWTAMAQPDGTVEFRRDLYGRDRRLAAALAARSPGTRLADADTGCRMVAA